MRKHIGLLPGVVVFFAVLFACRAGGQRTVVIYVSEDQVFSEPILRDFEKETGIQVKAVYDTEETKSTGAMNRLIAEKNNPQADVYWANEPVRAQVLKQQGVAQPYFPANAKTIPAEFKDSDGYWTGFSARARVLVVNKAVADKPRSILAYTDPARKGKGVIANPLFGTTTDEMAALFTVWGDDRAKRFMNDMKKNGVTLSTNNGESADFVSEGKSDFALADSDDAINRIRQGKSIEMVYPDQGDNEIGCLIVPNAVLLVKGARNAENGRKLIEYLLSNETERKLAFEDCAQIPLHPDVATPKDVPRVSTIRTMKIDYGQVAKKLEEIQPFLKDWVGF